MKSPQTYNSKKEFKLKEKIAEGAFAFIYNVNCPEFVAKIANKNPRSKVLLKIEFENYMKFGECPQLCKVE